MKTAFEKLASTMFLLLIASSFIVTSTFAWLSLNTDATMLGMKINVETYDNLLIAPDTGSATRAEDYLFVNGQVFELRGYLEPVSTVDALKFYYTNSNNVDRIGDALTEKYIPYEQYDPEEAIYGRMPAGDDTYANIFSENYGVKKSDALAMTGTNTSALGFIDYVFQLKATNPSDEDRNIVLTQLDLTCQGITNYCNAYRVAVFVQDITEDDATEAASDNLKGIYKEIFSHNYDDTPKAVNSGSTLAPVTYVSSAAALATVAPKSTAYYKVIFRLWLEGEDNTCQVDTYLALNYGWGLDIALELKPDLDGCVTALRDVSIVTAAAYSVTAEGEIVAKVNDADTALRPISNFIYDGVQVYTTDTVGKLHIDSHLFTVSGGIATDVTEYFRLQ